MGVVRFVKVDGEGVGRRFIWNAEKKAWPGCGKTKAVAFFSMFRSGAINISCLRLLECSQKDVCVCVCKWTVKEKFSDLEELNLLILFSQVCTIVWFCL